MSAIPLYDINRSFSENVQAGLDIPLPSFPRIWPPKQSWLSFLGYALASPIGVAACAVTTGRGIAVLAKLGFDILTYKTIRSRAHAGHAMPNIVYVDLKGLLTEQQLTTPVYATATLPSVLEGIAISNSFGNACFEPDVIIEDIALAKQALLPGQLLIVSVYGETTPSREVIADFVATAQLAKHAGADVIELNFSCPNLLTKEGPICLDAQSVFAVTKAVTRALGATPVIVKLGLFPTSISPEAVLVAAARAGAVGVAAINAVSMQVIAAGNRPVFGQRQYSGVSGNPIRQLALDFISRIAQINYAHRLNLVILGMGGITLAKHFLDFQQAGADVALTATGMMWNPYLAVDYHQFKRM